MSVTVKFGYLPEQMSLSVSDVRIESLPNLETKISEVESSPQVSRDWIHSPIQGTKVLGTTEPVVKPYPARVFSLPKTHRITHLSATVPHQIEFLVWVLSFLKGIRLTTTEAGFLDATPLTPGTLVDFIVTKGSLNHALQSADAFWNSNQDHPEVPARFSAAIHSMFLSNNRYLLTFEQFIYAYIALDACFSILTSTDPQHPKKPIPHSQRLKWMCESQNMPVPDWAEPNSKGKTQVSILRNESIHEALFAQQPLGFADHAIRAALDLPLQMTNLCSRLLVAILKINAPTYIKSSVSTRQRYRLGGG